MSTILGSILAGFVLIGLFFESIEPGFLREFWAAVKSIIHPE